MPSIAFEVADIVATVDNPWSRLGLSKPFKPAAGIEFVPLLDVFAVVAPFSAAVVKIVVVVPGLEGIEPVLELDVPPVVTSVGPPEVVFGLVLEELVEPEVLAGLEPGDSTGVAGSPVEPLLDVPGAGTVVLPGGSGVAPDASPGGGSPLEPVPGPPVPGDPLLGSPLLIVTPIVSEPSIALVMPVSGSVKVVEVVTESWVDKPKFANQGMVIILLHKV